MKYKRLLTLLLVLLFTVSCAAANSENAKLWKLGKRYDNLTYGTITHAFEYEKNGERFYLSVTRDKQAAGSSKNVQSSVTIDSLEYALCETDQKTPDGTRNFTYFECLTGDFRYVLGNAETALDMGSLLSLNEAAALMRSPAEVPDGVNYLGESWNAYFRTDASNLEVYIYVDDGGKHVSAASDTYETREEKGDVYRYSEYDRAILYSDGTNSVWIRQSDRAGMKHKAYDTLSECKAILAMLGSN